MSNVIGSYAAGIVNNYGPLMFSTLMLEYDDLSEVMLEIMTTQAMSEAVDFILENLENKNLIETRDGRYLTLYIMSSSIIRDEILEKTALRGLDKQLINMSLRALDNSVIYDLEPAFLKNFAPLLNALVLRSNAKLSELYIPQDCEMKNIWDIIAKTADDPVSEFKIMPVGDVYSSYSEIQKRFPEHLPSIEGCGSTIDEMDFNTANEFFDFLSFMHGKLEAYRLINELEGFFDSMDIDVYLEFLSSLIDKDEFIAIYGVNDVEQYLSPPFDGHNNNYDDNEQRILLSILLKSETPEKLRLNESALEYWEHNGVGSEIYRLVDVEKSSTKTKAKYLSNELGI